MPPIIVILFGPTGSGKSSFINTVSGSVLPVGDGLESETLDVTSTGIPLVKIGDSAIQLVDTPGFDDSRVGTDMEILERISKYLENSFRRGERVGGIIYMHRISDNKLSGSAKRNLQIFHSLCGQKSLKNTVFLTSMWTIPPKAAELAREAALKEHPSVKSNELATVARLEKNTQNEARDILRMFINNTPETLDIQDETANKGKKYYQSNAAGAIDPDLAREMVRNEAERRWKEVEVMVERLAEERIKREKAEAERKAKEAKRKREEEIMGEMARRHQLDMERLARIRRGPDIAVSITIPCVIM